MNPSFLRTTCAAMLLLGGLGPAQIQLVRDIFPGPGSGNPMALAELKGSLYFLARPIVGLGLWKYDPRTDETERLNIPNFPDGRPSQFTEAKDTIPSEQRLFFTVTLPDRTELWTTDGTEKGTYLCKTGPQAQLTPLNNTLVFSDDPSAGQELWYVHARSRNSTSNKLQVRGGNFKWFRTPTIAEVTSAGNKVALVANIESHAGEVIRDLLVFDGQKVELWPLSNARDAWPTNLTFFDGWIYYSARDKKHKRELWRTNGTKHEPFADITDLTTTEPDLNPRGSFPRGFTVVNNHMYFWADVPRVIEGRTVLKQELFRTNGKAGIHRVGDVIPANSIPALRGSRVGDKFLFKMRTPTERIEYWVSDGTKDGTGLLKDIHPNGSSDPHYPLPLGSRHTWFVADDGVHGLELWKATETSAEMVEDLYPRNPASGRNPSSSPENLVHLGGKVFFSAKTQETGRELFCVDAGAVSVPLGRGWSADGNPPKLEASDPKLNSNMTIRLVQLTPGSFAVVFYSRPVVNPWAIAPGAWVWLDSFSLVPLGGQIANGEVYAITFSLPMDPSLQGLHARLQAAAIMSGGGFVLTNAVDAFVDC